LLDDGRIAIRQLWHRPLFTLTAVLTLAIGIGVNAVAFTVVNGLLFRGSAVSVGSTVGRIVTTPGGDEEGNASLDEFRRFADATRGTVDLAAEGRSSIAWQHDGTTDTAWVLFVTPNYFSTVNARPLAGRLEVAAARGGMPSILIGERFWRQKLNAAPLAGLTLRLNNVEAAVAGILPESFTGPSGIYSPDVWLPLDDLELLRTSVQLRQRDVRWLFLLGTLNAGTTVAEAQTRVDAAVASMAHDWPDTHRQRGARFRMLRESGSERRGLTAAAGVAMGIIGVVLLLACFNVANLLLARAVERERDMGIRSALGAGTARLVRLVVIEGFLIATLAGAAALMLARWTQAFVGSFAIPIEEPQHIDLAPDVHVLTFIAVLVVIAGIAPGLWPAISAARVDVLRVLGSQGANAGVGRPSAMRRWLVGLQIGGSTVFLALAALFVQSYGNLSLSDLGFARERLLVAEFEPASHGYSVSRTQRYVDALLERARQLPGVTGAVVADRVPFFIGFERLTPVTSTAASCTLDNCSKYAVLAVAPDYFRTMGIRMAAGREFESRDDASSIVVNQPLAQQLWADGNGLGKVVHVGNAGRAVTVVGITGTTHTRGLNKEQPTLYLPFGEEQLKGALTLVARTTVPPEQLVRAFVEAAHAIDPDVSLTSVKPMERRIDVQLWPFRTVSWLFSICGALALLLGTVGLAGVVIHAVNRRIREFGIRVSVGATPRDLAAEVLRSSARLLLPGLFTGLILAAIGARLASALFVSVNVLNPSTYLAVAALEAIIVLAASLAPAVRAARLDPLTALRSD